MENLSPIMKDSLRNRLREFLINGTVQFHHTIATQILVSMDKDHAQAKSFYISYAVCFKPRVRSQTTFTKEGG